MYDQIAIRLFTLKRKRKLRDTECRLHSLLNRASLFFSINNVSNSRKIHLYRPQQSWAKVIFSEACVCPQAGGGGFWSRGGLGFFGGLQFFGGSPIFGGVSKFFFFFFFFQFFPPKISSGMHPPETVNARPARILLECILVILL